MVSFLYHNLSVVVIFVDFWLPFGYAGAPIGYAGAPFGYAGAPFWSFLAPLSVHVGRFWAPF